MLLTSLGPFFFLFSSLSLSPHCPRSSCSLFLPHEQLLVVAVGGAVVVVVLIIPAPGAPHFYPVSSCSQQQRWVRGWPLSCPSFIPFSSPHQCSHPFTPAFHPVSSHSQRQRWVLGSLSCPCHLSYVLSSLSLPTF
jgi:hypothetical protein